MKVILLQELKGKGGEGDVVDVAPGFANNYLLPQKLAILATKGNLKQLEQRKHNIAKREENRIADAEKMKAALEGATVKVEAKVGEEGQLFPPPSPPSWSPTPSRPPPTSMWTSAASSSAMPSRRLASTKWSTVSTATSRCP